MWLVRVKLMVEIACLWYSDVLHLSNGAGYVVVGYSLEILGGWNICRQA